MEDRKEQTGQTLKEQLNTLLRLNEKILKQEKFLAEMKATAKSLKKEVGEAIAKL